MLEFMFKCKKAIGIIVAISIVCSGSLFAGTIKGKIIDSNTKESVAGVPVIIKKKNLITVTDVDGYFVFRDLNPGSYVVNTQSLSFENTESTQLIIKSDNDLVRYDIYLKPKSTAIDEVKVTGNKVIETDVSARNTERLATNVMNVVSAKTIESLPDQNVADVMQRVSGVSMAKNNFGANSRVIIRGMPSRYNLSLVDGVLMPSSSSLGMFSSELVGRMEVVKSLQPDYEGDAIGGIVNTVTKQAPDTAFFKIQAGGGYNQYYFTHKFLTFDNSTVAAKDPSTLNGPDYLADASQFPRKNLIVKSVKAAPDLDFSFSGGRRFFNKKLGLMVAFSAQNTSIANTYNYTSYFFNPNINGLDIEYWESQVYSQSQKRFGGFAKLDFQLNNNNQISLYSSLFQTYELRVREYTDLQNDNSAQNYRPIQTQTETDNTQTSITSLKGEHNILETLSIDWTALYVAGNSQSPDFVNIEEAKLGNGSSNT